MREFFKGWRRKVGCIALVMACVFMGGWIRSDHTFDSISLNGNPFRYGIWSGSGRLHFMRSRHLDALPFFSSLSLEMEGLHGFKVDDNGIRTFDPLEGNDIEWRWDWAAFHASESTTASGGQTLRVKFWIVPYWFVTIPLTLLSAYLILWKPRKRTGADHA